MGGARTAGAGPAWHPGDRLRRLRPSGARGHRPSVRRADLSRAHAPRRRPGSDLPLQLPPVSLAVWLRDPVSSVETFARIKVPKEVLPRFVPLGGDVFVPLETVIARHLDELFPGMEILRHDFFRVTRDADFTVSDEADDLLRAVEDELRRRRFGEVVRLEVASTMDPDMRDYLIEQLAIEETQVIDVDGLLDLDDLWSLNEIEGHRELRYGPWTPEVPPAFAESDDGE